MTDTPPTDTFREVGRRRIAAGDARTAILRRTYEAPIEDVWDACTEPERLSRWFLAVTGDLRAGGRFSLAGNAGGEIVELEHATVSTEVEWEGRMLDVIPGVGSGWELPLAWALPAYLRGELPDAPAAEWYEPTPEHAAFAERSAKAWAALL